MAGSSIDGAIRNPADADHFMVVKPVNRRIRVYRGERLIADSTRALRLMEQFGKVCDPVIYVPADDLTEALDRLDKRTHCPLEGEAAYFALDGEEIGWAYPQPPGFAWQIAGFHAFWPDKVRLVEGT